MSVRQRASRRVHYNYFRDYDPATGGYAESDPIGLRGGMSTYAYVNRNPVSRIDPLGLAGSVVTPTPGGGILGIILGTPIAQPGSPENVAWANNAYNQMSEMLGANSSSAADSSSTAAACPPGDPCKGLRDRLREHEKKLQDYMNDPMRYDNLGMMGGANAAGLLLRMWDIYFGRIHSLQNQIANFRKLLAECEARYGK